MHIRRTPDRKAIKDLDSLPWPDYEGFEINEYLDLQLPYGQYYLYPLDKPRCMPMITTRSCPYSCTFCFHPIGKLYRKRSLDKFFDELEYLINTYNLNMIGLLDELFSTKRDRMFEFCDRIKKYNLLWSAQMRVRDIDEEIVLKLKESGCYVVSLGLESMNNDVLNSMKKKIKQSDINTALDLLYRNDIGIQGNFIFGDPAETENSIKETISWWKENIKYQINIGFISPYPGTPLWTHSRKKNLIVDPIKYISQGCPPINMTKMSDDKYDEMVSFVDKTTNSNILWGRLKSIQKLDGVNSYSGEALWRVTAECPHCNTNTTYKNYTMVYYSKSTKIYCRNCNMKYSLKGKVDLLHMFKDYIVTNKLRHPVLYKNLRTIKKRVETILVSIKSIVFNA